MKKIIILLLAVLIGGSFNQVFATEELKDVDQTEKTKEPKEKKEKKKKEKDPDGIRRGWTFGILPSVSYDADLGFQYGALANIYYFGDGSTYPEYLHSFYVEASYTTK